jgi:hypothetical protein
MSHCGAFLSQPLVLIGFDKLMIILFDGLGKLTVRAGHCNRMRACSNVSREKDKGPYI